MIRVIVAGTRDFNDFFSVEKILMGYFELHQLHRADVEIVSGGARGADKLGEKFANKYGCKLTKFPADWEYYGKSAGYIRNEQMAKYASESNGVLFAFWNGVSKGTKHMIELAGKYNLDVNIICF